jgi:hypothetical protein
MNFSFKIQQYFRATSLRVMDSEDQNRSSVPPAKEKEEMDEENTEDEAELYKDLSSAVLAELTKAPISEEWILAHFPKWSTKAKKSMIQES